MARVTMRLSDYSASFRREAEYGFSCQDECVAGYRGTNFSLPDSDWDTLYVSCITHDCEFEAGRYSLMKTLKILECTRPFWSAASNPADGFRDDEIVLSFQLVRANQFSTVCTQWPGRCGHRFLSCAAARLHSDNWCGSRLIA